jgi:hypothetical protein
VDHGPHLRGVQPPDPMVAQQAGDPPCGETVLVGRRRGQPQERPEPGLVGCRAERQHPWREAIHQVAELIGEPPLLVAEILIDPRPLPHLEDERMIGADTTKRLRVGA